MPGGAGLIWVLAGCVSAERLTIPDRPPRAMDHHEELAATPAGAGVSPSGSVVGPCSGSVLVEVDDASGAELGRAEATNGKWSIAAVNGAITTVRYGCDGDGDRVVEPADVVEVDAASLPGKNATLILLPPAIGHVALGPPQ